MCRLIYRASAAASIFLFAERERERLHIYIYVHCLFTRPRVDLYLYREISILADRFLFVAGERIRFSCRRRRTFQIASLVLSFPAREHRGWAIERPRLAQPSQPVSIGNYSLSSLFTGWKSKQKRRGRVEYCLVPPWRICTRSKCRVRLESRELDAKKTTCWCNKYIGEIYYFSTSNLYVRKKL